MEQIREYVVGIGAAAVICAITLSFSARGKLQPLLKLICGLVLTFSIVRPVLAFSSGDLELLGMDYREEAREASEEGRKRGEETLRDIISRETSTYILSKAQAMGLALNVQVFLTEKGTPIPERVILEGDASPYEKQKLSWMLKEELGIREENQKWIS